MKSIFATLFAIAGIAAVLAPVAAVAAPPTALAERIAPAQSRYPRGTRVTLVAKLTCYGAPVSNQVIWYWESSSKGTVKLFYGITNYDGYSLCPYQVPTDVNKDNVYLWTAFAGTKTAGASNSTPFRIPIGL